MRIQAAYGVSVEVRPRVGVHPVLGEVDGVYAVEAGGGGASSAAPLAVFSALDWGAVDRIPGLDRPQALPPGAGSGILNRIAELAKEQGRRAALRYRGPYPTAQLLDALVECFRPASLAPEAIAPFLADGADAAVSSCEPAIDLFPDPHERVAWPDGTLVQVRRGRPERIFRGGLSYAIDGLFGLARSRARRIRDAGEGRFVAYVRALEETLEDVVSLDGAGRLLGEPVAPIRPHPDPLPEGEGEELDPLWRPALAALLVPRAARPLAAPLGGLLLDGAPIVTGEVRGDLSRLDPATSGLVVRADLLELFRRKLASARDREARLALAARLVGDVLLAVEPLALRLAQRALEGLTGAGAGSGTGSGTGAAPPDIDPDGPIRLISALAGI